MSKSGTPDEIALACALRDLRLSAGLSGESLGRAIGMSQPKLSRIELRQQVPTVEEAEMWLDATRADPDRRVEVLAYLRTVLSTRSTDQFDFGAGTRNPQTNIIEVERKTMRFRSFNPDMIHGLLQIPEYTRRIVCAKPARVSENTLDEMLKQRIERQEVLDDVDRHFEFILTEQLLLAGPMSHEVMRPQLEHLISVSRRNNVELGILPNAVQDLVPRWIPIALFDERMLVADILYGLVTLTYSADVAYAMECFAELKAVSVWGDEARVLIQTHLD